MFLVLIRDLNEFSDSKLRMGNHSMLLQLRAENIQFILTILCICLVLLVCRVPKVFGINSAKYSGVLL